MPRCGSAAASAPAASGSRPSLFPIDNSSPPSSRSSSDLQRHSKHSQDHGNPEVDTVEPEPSSLRSAFGPTGNCFPATCHHHSLTERTRSASSQEARKNVAESEVHGRAAPGLGCAGPLKLSHKLSVIVLSLSWTFAPRLVQLVLTKLNS